MAMETFLVTAIVLAASVAVLRQLVKKFRKPEKMHCNGGCCTCKKPANSKEKDNNAI